MGCREFFDENADNDKLCKALQAETLETQISWESQVASNHSPMPVNDLEDVVRYWQTPHHYDSTAGALKVTAFDDAAGFGLSINRLNFTTLATVRAAAQLRVDDWNKSHTERPQRYLLGYSTLTVSEIRDVMTSSAFLVRRGLGVYDTAKHDDNSHADICQIASDAQGGRSARYLMRDRANKLFNKF